jgi:hypothetical protein
MHGYQKPANISHPPCVSRGTSPTENSTWISEKRVHYHHESALTRRSRSSDTVNPSTGLAPPTTFAHSRVRSSDSRIFTSPYAPPPIPPAYIASHRNSSDDAVAHSFHPPIHRASLTRPPRLSGTDVNSGPVPSFVPQYSVSAWRAIHPGESTPMLPSTRSHPHLHSTEFSYQSQYSRSSVSLTRPTRLSSLSSSSQNWSDGLESRDGPFHGGINGSERATPSEIAHAFKDGTPIPGTEHIVSQIRHHTRAASAPHVASYKDIHKGLQVKIVTRKPVPVRRLRSADRVGFSSAFVYAEVAEDNANRIPSDSRNKLESAGSVGARGMIFEQVKNKPLPKIAVF